MTGNAELSKRFDELVEKMETGLSELRRYEIIYRDQIEDANDRELVLGITQQLKHRETDHSREADLDRKKLNERLGELTYAKSSHDWKKNQLRELSGEINKLDYFPDKVPEFKTRKIGPTVVIDGWAGSGKSTLGRRVADKFGLYIHSVGDRFRRHANRNDIQLEDIATSVTPAFVREVYLEAGKLGEIGGAVVLGRLLGATTLQNADYKVCLDISIDERARRLGKRDGYSIGEETEMVRKRDREARESIVKAMDIFEPRYDIVINDDRASSAEIGGRVIAGIKEKLGLKERV